MGGYCSHHCCIPAPRGKTGFSLSCVDGSLDSIQKLNYCFIYSSSYPDRMLLVLHTYLGLNIHRKPCSLLTVKNAASPINNLEDILKSSYKVLLIESGSTYEFFKTSQYKTHQRIWNRVKAEHTFVKTTKEALQWLRETEESVFISDGPIVRYAANHPPCDLMTGIRFWFLFLFGQIWWYFGKIQKSKMTYPIFKNTTANL